MAEFAVYCDVGGHPSDQRFVVVAGFLSTVERWALFERDWRHALIRHGLSSPFHMVDVVAGKGTNRDQGRVLDDLIRIINQHTIAHFSVLIDMKDYKEVNGIYTLEESIGTPYAIAARCVAKYINEWKAKNFKTGDSLEIFVESGTLHQGDMEEAFRRDALPLPRRVPKALAAVAPADILAWESFRYAKRHDERRSLVNLWQGRLFYQGILKAHNLTTTCQSAGAPLRSTLPENAKVVFLGSKKRKRAAVRLPFLGAPSALLHAGDEKRCARLRLDDRYDETESVQISDPSSKLSG